MKAYLREIHQDNTAGQVRNIRTELQLCVGDVLIEGDDTYDVLSRIIAIDEGQAIAVYFNIMKRSRLQVIQ